MRIRVLQIGLGPIGLGVTRQLVDRQGFQLAGAVDIDPAKIGHDVGELIGAGKPLRIKVTSDIARAIKACQPDVAVVCTSSSLKTALPELETVVRHRVPVVTTAEEAAYAAPRNRRLAARLDAAAMKAKVAVIGTGVNPGFTMDALPIALTATCARVDRIEVQRVQDARIRRQPFQQKIGTGLTEEAFRREVAQGRVRHVGFAESIQMIADAIGWRLDRIRDDVSPMLAARRVVSDFFDVEAGRVAGLVQTGIGYVKGAPLISLRLEAYLGAPESYDSVRIEGLPPLYSKIEGGVHGDIATVSMAVNAIPSVIVAAPGLRTMRDLRLPSFYGGR